MNPDNLENTLVWLQKKEALSEKWLTDTNANLHEHDIESPWYVRIMVGFSAWITMILIIAFLFSSGLVRSTSAALIAGIFCLIIAILLHKKTADNEFKTQITLALSLAAQGLIWFGLSKNGGMLTASSLVVVLSVALIYLYNDSLHRFLSVLILLTACVSIISRLHQPGLYTVLVITTSALIVALHCHRDFFMQPRLASMYTPLLYGLIVGLVLLLLPSSFYTSRYNRIPLDLFSTSAGLGITLLYLQYRILSSYQLAGINPLTASVMLITLILAITTSSAPGIMAMLLIVAIGFSRRQKSLEGLGMLFLVWYLSSWYYNMNSSLLEKSVSLSIAGLLLIIAAYGINHIKTTEPAR